MELSDNAKSSPQSSSDELGMFKYMKFDGHKSDNENISLDFHQTHYSELTSKEKLKHILHSKPVHITIIVLVILDVIFVVLELLIDLDAITLEESNPLPSILHGFSIAILSAFMVEIGIKIYADYKHFIHHKVEVIDAIVVVVSFGADLALAFDEESILAAIGLLVILRLWRVLRIFNGVIFTIKSEADNRVHEIKAKNRALEEILKKAQEKLQSQINEIKELKRLLVENGVDVKFEDESHSVDWFIHKTTEA
ncbi:voltage-gated hydrogen channel 1-like [Clavelina lepadiformis]|uniref:voltage-gated hydrogen channel 1-like n=1 Tax=Clavelina lepadiformis TaxID=159417 RepID=UPI00404378BC